MSDLVIVAEAVVELREAAARAGALVAKLESTESVLRAAKVSEELQRQLGNMTEWARMLKARADRLAEKIAEGA